MNNQILAIWGLYFSHSFKKIMLSFALYLIGNLSFFYVYFSQAEQQFYHDGYLYYINSGYFAFFTFLFFAANLYFVFRANAEINEDSINICNRLTQSKLAVSCRGILYQLLCYSLLHGMVMITVYCGYQLYLKLNPLAIYHQANFYVEVFNFSFLRSVLPIYPKFAFTFRWMMYVLFILGLSYWQLGKKATVYFHIFGALGFAFALVFMA